MGIYYQLLLTTSPNFIQDVQAKMSEGQDLYRGIGWLWRREYDEVRFGEDGEFGFEPSSRKPPHSYVSEQSYKWWDFGGYLKNLSNEISGLFKLEYLSETGDRGMYWSQDGALHHVKATITFERPCWTTDDVVNTPFL